MYVSEGALPYATNGSAGLPEHLAWAITIAVAFSFVLAAIEISSESKRPLRSCLVPQSFLYCMLLAFGNVVTTLLATGLVASMPHGFAPFYFIFAAFLGIFAFEAVLKNTNVTVWDKGVLTIQDWIKKARSLAAGAAIERDILRTAIEVEKLATKLTKIPDVTLNTFVALHLPPKTGADIVPQLEAEAQANSADPKLYKAYALVTVLSRSEVLAFLQKK